MLGKDLRREDTCKPLLMNDFSFPYQVSFSVQGTSHHRLKVRLPPSFLFIDNDQLFPVFLTFFGRVHSIKDLSSVVV